MTIATAPDSVRSGFVTGLAWPFIALAGVATFIALLQNIMQARIHCSLTTTP